MSHRLKRSLQAALWIVGLQLLLCLTFRTVFWVLYSSRESIPGADWAHAWAIGARFDLRLALLVSLPVLLLTLVPGLAPLRESRARYGWLAFYALLEGLLILAYAVDLGHYDYLRVRLNAGALDHLGAPAIAAQMVWETYPVVWGALALALMVAGYLWLLARFAWRPFERPLPTLPAPCRTRLALGCCVLLYALGIYGKVSWYPLRWSDAFFATHPAVSSFALNPALYFVDSLPNRELDYDDARVREAYPRVVGLLEVEAPDSETLSYQRVAAARTPFSLPAAMDAPRTNASIANASSRRSAAAPPNLVVIHLESFAAFKTGAFGNELGATPHFDQIAAEALLFENFFVPSGPTARAVFSLLTGTPDVNHHRSASRNPRIVSQHTIVNALREHAKLYFLGGSATWGNIRGLLAANIDDLDIFEEGDYDAERVDVWGISDLALLEAAHHEFVGREEPFFAFIQTSGNHRPYTIPADNRGFVGTDLPEDVLRTGGFEDATAYDGIHFMDHALGLFFDLARGADYFENTVFAFYGDHGVPAPHGIAYEAIGLTENHVPGVIYAPGFLPNGRRIAAVANLVDLLPTCLGLMGVEYVNQTLGRDLLVPREEAARFSFLIGGLATDEFLMRVPPSGPARLFRYLGTAPTKNVALKFPDEVQRLERLYRDLNATAEWMLHHNAPADLHASSDTSR